LIPRPFSDMNSCVSKRLGVLLVGFLQLVLGGPLCACAIDHTLFCNGSPGTPVETSADPCGDSQCGANCTGCPRHHHDTQCSRRDSSNPAQNPSATVGLPDAAVFAPMGVSDPCRRQSPLHKVPADTSPGSRRTVPLLN
jgi:hypothetical protein